MNTQLDRMKMSGDSESEEAQVAQLAYQMSQSRGCPEGSPEEDWYRAEQEMKHQQEAPRAMAA